MTEMPLAEEESDDFRRQRAFLLETAPLLAEDFLKAARENRHERAEKDAQIADDIAHIWARGWTVFDGVIYSMEQSAALMFQRSDVEDGHESVREALLMLQCAATLTLREIHKLLRAGYLAGSAARWRALHETAVTAIAVAEGGPMIARRYLDHGIVTQLSRLEEFYRQPHPEAPSDEERAERLLLIAGLVRTHSLEDESIGFAKPYAWATPLMKRRRDGKFLEPTLTRLEEIARQSDMRLLVQHGAHGHVHGDAGAVRTAVLRDGVELLAGPRPEEIPTVAVPTLRTIAIIAAATHMGHEPELNEFGRLICLTGAAVADLAMRGVVEFKSVHRTARLLF